MTIYFISSCHVETVALLERKYRDDGEYMRNRDLNQIMADHYDTPWQELPRQTGGKAACGGRNDRKKSGRDAVRLRAQDGHSAEHPQ